MNIRVVTDSACDLPDDLVDKHRIEIVPLTIRFGDLEFVDRFELDSEAFWTRVADSDTLPETSAPSAGAFEKTFTKLFDEGADAILCVNLASRLSATMQSAEVAAKSVADRGNVRVVDSLSVSLIQGNLAVTAAERAEAGDDLDAVVTEVERQRDHGRLYATLDTLENLRKGGRIGGAQALLGSMLSIKPIVTFTDGEVTPLAKVRTRGKSLRWLVDKVAEEKVEHVGVVHADASDLDDFLEMLRPVVPGEDIIVGTIGPVVGTHSGPGAIAVTFTTVDD
ncbi:MAG: DegV family protein [Acidimicrobiia bacterium]|nr:DegV family protein [Acidimicrobiia bacterium]